MPVESRPEPPEALPAPVIDSHTHLDVHDWSLHGETAPDPNELLQQAAAVGVTKVVQIGCDVESAEWSVSFSKSHPQVAVGVGLHPNDAARLAVAAGPGLDQAWERIVELADEESVVAIGETGLDFFRTPEPEGRRWQAESFRRHIRLAKMLNKALVIHDRDSHRDVIDVLTDEGPPDRVVFHCFSGDDDMARQCASQGWFMSFAGVVTFRNAETSRRAQASVPDDLLLVETDAPYLTPVPHRGRANGSYLMPWTVRTLAQERGCGEADICEMLTANTIRAFGAW